GDRIGADAVLRVAQPLARLEREGPLVERAGDLRYVAGRAEEPAPEDDVLPVRADGLRRIPGAAGREVEDGDRRLAVWDRDTAVAWQAGDPRHVHPSGCGFGRRRDGRRRGPVRGSLLPALADEGQRRCARIGVDGGAEGPPTLGVAHHGGPLATVRGRE